MIYVNLSIFVHVTWKFEKATATQRLGGFFIAIENFEMSKLLRNITAESSMNNCDDFKLRAIEE